MGIVENIATEYQVDIQTEGMMNYMVRYLPSENLQLKKHCASAIYKVLKNSAGALSEVAKVAENRELILEAGGIELLINLLTLGNCPLLENVTKVLGECANEPACMTKIEQLDGIRLIWSLLKNKDPGVQASAAWALVPCIHNSKDAGDMVRSLVGGLELLVGLLRSENDSVIAAVCAALAEIAQDRENLAVITDHGVLPLLCRHVVTEDEAVREQVALAVGGCCALGGNCRELGRLGAVGPLVSYMSGASPGVRRATALALHRLSHDPANCVTLHQAGVVLFLLETISSEDEALQEASAGCLSNIRKMALAADEFIM